MQVSTSIKWCWFDPQGLPTLPESCKRNLLLWMWIWIWLWTGLNMSRICPGIYLSPGLHEEPLVHVLGNSYWLYTVHLHTQNFFFSIDTIWVGVEGTDRWRYETNVKWEFCISVFCSIFILLYPFQPQQYLLTLLLKPRWCKKKFLDQFFQ